MKSSPELGLDSQFGAKAVARHRLSDEMELAVDPAGNVSVGLDIHNRAGKPSVGAEFARDTGVEQAALKPVEEHPDLPPGRHSSRQIKPDRANQVSIFKQELRNEIERLTGGLAVLEGGKKKNILRLSPEAKSVVDVQIVNIIKNWEINNSGGRRANVWPEEYYVVSRADGERLKQKINDAPTGAGCELKEFAGGFVARLGGEEAPVVFITSGPGELEAQDEEEKLAA